MPEKMLKNYPYRILREGKGKAVVLSLANDMKALYYINARQ